MSPTPSVVNTWEGICNPELFHEEQRFEPHILTTQLLKPEHWAPKTSSFESPQGLHRLSAQSPMQRQQLKSALFCVKDTFLLILKTAWGVGVQFNTHLGAHWNTEAAGRHLCSVLPHALVSVRKEIVQLGLILQLQPRGPLALVASGACVRRFNWMIAKKEFLNASHPRCKWRGSTRRSTLFHI